jgi:chromosomal replication initiator protein
LLTQKPVKTNLFLQSPCGETQYNNSNKDNFFLKNMNKTAQSVWGNCLSFIKDNIQSQAFKTWFEPITPVELAGNVLHIQVPSKFFYEWLEEHYVKLLKLALTKELGEGAKLLYKIKMENAVGNKQPFTEQLPGSNRMPMKPQEVDFPLQNKDPELKNPFIIPGIRNVKIESQLNPNYSFENFLEGDSNRLARSAGMAVANKPGGTSFNPLLIFGGVGLGKTHLAHAIGVEIKEKFPEKTVLYISAEVFTQQFVDSVRKNTRSDFIHFYQLIDVLIIDDVQFLSGKAGTQDVFFHIFNHLHQNGKQVILTSDKAPVDMQDIEQRLLSRFKWGLSAELQQPDYETRFSILKNILYRDGVEMSDEIVEYVAKNVKINVRELEGAIISLIAQSSFNKKEVTLDLAKQVVEKFVKNIKREISIDYIQKVVSDYFQLDVETLQSKTRKRHIVQARQLAMFFAKKYTKASLQNIGSQIGDRDHATVLHACKTVDNLIETDRHFKKFVDDITKKLSV